MLIIGLTGGVASGKNFIASCFERFRVPVFDADLEVHKLFFSDAEVFNKVKQSFPESIINNKIDRKILGPIVFADKIKLQNLEQIIHPSLKKKEDIFIKNCRTNRRKIVILNIPLLFEKGGYKRCHKNIAVITPIKTQFHRFQNRLKSIGVSDLDLIYKQFNNITKHQTNNLQRKRLADYVIYNGLNKALTFKQVRNLLIGNQIL